MNQSSEVIGRPVNEPSQDLESPKIQGQFRTHKSRIREKLAKQEKRNVDDVTCFGSTRVPGRMDINSRDQRMRETSINPLYESTEVLV